ncbi:hypothetical protein MAR_016298 [Mya arenaria]|uniref:Uncharacterized protein n=1 Tax=Mya arenaria TaxID=6604 RepID=A0ABY7FN81_MYAAR|nr:hypothetical protein MAR_016298 [Mya arenaria]
MYFGLSAYIIYCRLLEYITLISANEYVLINNHCENGKKVFFSLKMFITRWHKFERVFNKLSGFISEIADQCSSGSSSKNAKCRMFFFSFRSMYISKNKNKKIIFMTRIKSTYDIHFSYNLLFINVMSNVKLYNLCVGLYCFVLYYYYMSFNLCIGFYCFVL